MHKLRRGPSRVTVSKADCNDLDFDYSPDGVLCLRQDQPFTGVGIEQYPDGCLRAESVFRNGLDTQADSLLYPTGQLKRRLPECSVLN